MSKSNFNKDTRYVLDKIGAILYYTKEGSITYSDYCNIVEPDLTYKISIAAERLVLDRLQQTGAIKILPYVLTRRDYGNLTTIGQTEAVSTKAIPWFSSIEINKKEFDKFSKEYPESSAKKPAHSAHILLSLTRRGKLSRILNEGDEQIYQMEPGKIKYLIIQALVEQKSVPITAIALSEHIKTTPTNIRKEIGSLRHEVERRLSISRSEFIPAAQKGGEGYSLGKNIKIHIK